MDVIGIDPVNNALVVVPLAGAFQPLHLKENKKSYGKPPSSLFVRPTDTWNPVAIATQSQGHIIDSKAIKAAALKTVARLESKAKKKVSRQANRAKFKKLACQIAKRIGFKKPVRNWKLAVEIEVFLQDRGEYIYDKRCSIRNRLRSMSARL